jgi:hypothetical protein
MPLLLALLLCMLTMLPALAQNNPKTYPQLISTRYPTGQPLPADYQPPTPHYDFVDKSKLPSGAQILSAAKAQNGIIWIVTDKGIFRAQDGKYGPLVEGPSHFKPLQPPINSDTIVTYVTSDSDGHIWAATTSGLYATDGDQWWQTFDRRDGMPIEMLTCISLAANGDIWGGTVDGAWRLRDGQFRYFWGPRWLPGNRVSAVWTDAQGRAWITTDGGVACIEEKPTTLAQKAAYFDAFTQKYNNRHGFINEVTLKTPGDLSQGGVFEISDNDGLWNAIYVGAMSYRYAATHDPAARQEAKQALDAMLELERLTGISGYPARAVVSDAELSAGVTGVNLQETVRVPGETDKIWFRSPVEKDIWCKGDTSSDELDGHYYAWYVYHDLVADDADKQRVAAVARRVTDHIIAGGYNLIGHTGRKTRWGIWAPSLLNDDPFFVEQRPLNSLEILGYLKIAAHITGDQKYEQAYEELIQKHHYLLNILLHRRNEGGAWPNINHSDDEMAYMMYYALIRLETDPSRRRILLHSLAHTWEDSAHELTLKAERSPLYDFMYGALTGKPCSPDEAIQTLEDWSWDRISWTMRNSQRQDVTFKQAEGIDRHTELTRVLPVSERALARWNSNPWEPDGGGGGRVVDDGAAWLLGYWLGVYHGYISKDQ